MSAHTDGYIGEMTLPLSAYMALLESNRDLLAALKAAHKALYGIAVDPRVWERNDMINLAMDAECAARAVISQHEE